MFVRDGRKYHYSQDGTHEVGERKKIQKTDPENHTTSQ